MTTSPVPTPRPARRDDPRMRTVEMAAVHVPDLEESDTLGSGPVRAPLSVVKVGLLVAAGGTIGGILRFLLAVAFPVVATPTLVEMPWSTLAVNVTGSLALGALVGVLEARPAPPWVMPLLGTGLCGGFTTMSAVVLEGSAMLGADFPIYALTYAVLTVVSCIGSVVIGLFGGKRVALLHRSYTRGEVASSTGSARREQR